MTIKNEKAITNMDSLEEVIHSSLKRNGIDRQLSRKVCSDIIAEFIRVCGGNLFYVSTLYHEQLAERNNELVGKFNGRNHSQLAKEYGLSVPQVYRIIKEYADARRIRDQRALF